MALINIKLEDKWFQQDITTPHFSNQTIEILKGKFNAPVFQETVRLNEKLSADLNNEIINMNQNYFKMVLIVLTKERRFVELQEVVIDQILVFVYECYNCTYKKIKSKQILFII